MTEISSLRGARLHKKRKFKGGQNGVIPAPRVCSWGLPLRQIQAEFTGVGVRERRPHSDLQKKLNRLNLAALLPVQLADFEGARYSLQSSENKNRRQLYVR